MAEEKKSDEPVNYLINNELVATRTVTVYTGAMAYNWWKNGKQAIEDGTVKAIATGLLSSSSLKELKFEMKGKLTNDPLYDLLKPIVKQVGKFGAKKNKMLGMIMQATDNDPIAVLQNILMITSIASQSASNDKNLNSKVEVPVAGLKIPVYENMPYVTAPLDQPIEIEFRYGYNGGKSETVKESYNGFADVTNQIQAIVNELPKVDVSYNADKMIERTISIDGTNVKVKQPDPTSISTKVEASLPTKPGFYAGLLRNAMPFINGPAKDAEDGKEPDPGGIFTINNNLGAPVSDKKAGQKALDSAYTKAAQELVKAANGLGIDETKDWNMDNVAENVIQWYGSASNAGQMEGQSWTEVAPNTDDENDLSSTYTAYGKIYSGGAAHFGDGVSGRKKSLMKFEAKRGQMFKAMYNTDISNFTEMKGDLSSTGTSSIYDLKANQSDSAVFLAAKTMLSLPDKINAAVLNSMGDVKVFVLKAAGGIYIGPFLPAQCSWSFDLSKGLDSGKNPMAGAFKFSQITTILPGVNQMVIDFENPTGKA